MAITVDQWIEIAKLSAHSIHAQAAANMAANALQDMMREDEESSVASKLEYAQAALAAERKINAELRKERENYRLDVQRSTGLENALVVMQSHREHLEAQLRAALEDSRMLDYVAKMPADLVRLPNGVWECVVDLNNNKKYSGSDKYIHIAGDSIRRAIFAAMAQMSYFE